MKQFSLRATPIALEDKHTGWQAVILFLHDSVGKSDEVLLDGRTHAANLIALIAVFGLSCN